MQYALTVYFLDLRSQTGGGAPRPKEWGMLRAARPFFGILEIFESSLPRFPWFTRLKLCFRFPLSSHQRISN